MLYYRKLKYYFDNGMSLITAHREFGFPKSRCMWPYISMNSHMRAAAKNHTDKDVHKLMKKAVYGKTCENQRKRNGIQIVNDRLKAAKLVDKANCLDARIFNEKRVGVMMQKLKLLLIKHSYLCFVVLDLAKLHMLMDAYPAIPKTISYILLSHMFTYYLHITSIQ